MARFEFGGIDTYIQQLNKLQAATRDGVIGETVYAGAEVVADSVRSAIQALPVGSGQASGNELVDTVTLPQKAGLLDGFGISRMKDDNGFINVKLGFAGYNATRTAKYPRGQPNALIARSVNSGTTFRKKTKFVDKAVNSARKSAETAMDAACSREIEKIMK